MAFQPTRYGPHCRMGRITVTVPGISVLFNSNWSPAYDSESTTDLSPTISCADIVINPGRDNAGDLYVVNRGGSKNDPTTIVLRIPKGPGPQSEGPFHLAQSLKNNSFAPEAYALDADQANDYADISGVIL